MMKTIRLGFLGLLALLLTLSTAQAGGLYLYEIGDGEIRRDK